MGAGDRLGEGGLDLARIVKPEAIVEIDRNMREGCEFCDAIEFFEVAVVLGHEIPYPVDDLRMRGGIRAPLRRGGIVGIRRLESGAREACQQNGKDSSGSDEGCEWAGG